MQLIARAVQLGAERTAPFVASREHCACDREWASTRRMECLGGTAVGGRGGSQTPDRASDRISTEIDLSLDPTDSPTVMLSLVLAPSGYTTAHGLRSNSRITMMAAAAPATVDVSNHAHEIAFIPTPSSLLEKKPVK